MFGDLRQERGKRHIVESHFMCIYIYTPGPFTVEVRMEKPVGLHGSRLRPIPGEKVKLGYRASKCRKTDRESLPWK